MVLARREPRHLGERGVQQRGRPPRRVLHQDLREPLFAEHLGVLVGGLGHAVGVEQQHVTGQQLPLVGLELGRGDEAQRRAVRGDLFDIAGRGAVDPRSRDASSATERQADRRIEVVIIAMERGRAKLYEEAIKR